MVGTTEVVLKSSHGLSGAVFGAPLEASKADEGSVGNQVAATADDKGAGVVSPP